VDNKLYKIHGTYIKIRTRKSASIKIIIKDGRISIPQTTICIKIPQAMDNV